MNARGIGSGDFGASLSAELDRSRVASVAAACVAFSTFASTAIFCPSAMHCRPRFLLWRGAPVNGFDDNADHRPTAPPTCSTLSLSSLPSYLVDIVRPGTWQCDDYCFAPSIDPGYSAVRARLKPLSISGEWEKLDQAGSVRYKRDHGPRHFSIIHNVSYTPLFLRFSLNDNQHDFSLSASGGSRWLPFLPRQRPSH